jgi:hypothetical protein
VVHRNGRRSVEHRRLVACIMKRCFGILARRFWQAEVCATPGHSCSASCA